MTPQELEKIKDLRDYAELAWAAYGYFHLTDSNYKPDEYSKDGKRLKYFRKLKKQELEQLNPDITDQELQNTYPTPADILNIEYKYFKDENDKPQDSWYHKHFLGGDFSPTQAKRFSERYELIHHIPNTLSGFSATIFYDIKNLIQLQIQKSLKNTLNISSLLGVQNLQGK